jgi:N-acetylneuraminic acid mutarotase
MPTARSGAAAEQISGIIYVAGGYNSETLAAAMLLEAFDPASNTWTSKASLPDGRYQGNGAGAIAGRMYVAGGWSTSGPFVTTTNSVFVYDPNTDVWSSRANMPTPGAAGATGVIDGKLYVVPAFAFGAYAALLYSYDPATDAWATLTPPPHIHDRPAAVVLNGKFYLAGGFEIDGATNGVSATLDMYDPASDSWTTLSPMPTARVGAAGAALDGRFYVVGGATSVGPDFSTVEVYDPVADTWTTDTPLPTPRGELVASVVAGNIYAIGGGSCGSCAVPTVEASEPASGSVTMIVPTDGAIAKTNPGSTGSIGTLFGDQDVGEPDRPYYDARGGFHDSGDPPDPPKWHHGVDIVGPHQWDAATSKIVGTNSVVAVADGMVVFVGKEGVHGDVVAIRHDAIAGPPERPFVYTFYSHMGSKYSKQTLVPTNIRRGLRVTAGQIIGCQGNSGNTKPANPKDKAGGTHLHFEIRVSARLIDATTYVAEERLDLASDLFLTSPDNFMRQNLSNSTIPGARRPATEETTGVGICTL